MQNENLIYRMIDDIDFSMAMEDMPLTSQDKQILYDCAIGKLNINDVLKETIKEHSVSAA